jgi:hypothetical protein
LNCSFCTGKDLNIRLAKGLYGFRPHLSGNQHIYTGIGDHFSRLDACSPWQVLLLRIAQKRGGLRAGIIDDKSDASAKPRIQGILQRLPGGTDRNFHRYISFIFKYYVPIYALTS